MLRRIRKSPRVRLEGETVWEVFTYRDKTPVGIALARIVRSQPHYHRRTHELYVHVRGSGIVGLGNRRVRFGKGAVLYIAPGIVHSAERYGSKPFEILAISYPPWSAKDHFVVRR